MTLATIQGANSRRAIEEWARATGENADDVRAVDERWATQLREMTKIDLHVGRCRAKEKLTLADLGIDEESLSKEQIAAMQRTLSLGDKYLLPKSEMDTLAHIDGQARTVTINTSLSTRIGRLVDARNYRTWKQAMERLKEEYLAAGRSMLDRWDEILAAAARDHSIMALQNYYRLQRNHTGSREAFIAKYGDEQTFVRNTVERIMGQVPSRAQFEQMLTFTWERQPVLPPSAIAEDFAAAAERRAAAMRIEAEARAEAERLSNETWLQGAADRERAQTMQQAERQLATQQAEIARLEHEAVVERTRARNAALLEMERDIAADMATARAKIFGVIDDLQASLHGDIYETLVAALLQLKERKPLKGGGQAVPVARLKTLLDTVERLKVWDDPMLEENLREVQAMIKVHQKDRNAGAIEAKVREIAAASKLVLLEFDEYAELRSSRAVGIPDDMASVEAMVRGPHASELPLDDAPLSIETARSRRAQTDL
jgi:hypothetical protein